MSALRTRQRPEVEPGRDLVPDGVGEFVGRAVGVDRDDDLVGPFDRLGVACARGPEAFVDLEPVGGRASAGEAFERDLRSAMADHTQDDGTFEEVLEFYCILAFPA